jgi:hypothetical protein
MEMKSCSKPLDQARVLEISNISWPILPKGIKEGELQERVAPKSHKRKGVLEKESFINNPQKGCVARR